MKVKEYAFMFIKGFAIGIANAIPGVSGGTIAFVLGIYERLTNAIANLLNIFKNPKEVIKESCRILLPVGLGAMLAIVVFLNIIVYLFDHYPAPTQIFFVGLILGSLPVITKEIKSGFNPLNFISFFGGAFIMSLFVYFDMNIVKESAQAVYTGLSFFYAAKLFVCGILAAAAMIIPGISGSLLLLILGEYKNVSYFVKTFEIAPLAFFGAGVVIGIFFVSKAVTVILVKYREKLFSFVLGLIIVSLLSLWPSFKEMNAPLVFTTVLSMCVGFMLSQIFEKVNG